MALESLCMIVLKFKPIFLLKRSLYCFKAHIDHKLHLPQCILVVTHKGKDISPLGKCQGVFPTSGLRNLHKSILPCPRREVDTQGRQFHKQWENKYMFVLQGENPVCLLCYCMRWCWSKHDKFSLQEKQKLQQNQKANCTCSRICSQKQLPKMTAVKASFIVAKEIA